MSDRPEWADDLVKKVDNLADQVSQNCSKLDKMGDKLDKVFDMCEANGQGIEVLSERVGKLENKLT